MATLRQSGLSALTAVAVVAGVLVAILAIASFADQLAGDGAADGTDTGTDGGDATVAEQDRVAHSPLVVKRVYGATTEEGFGHWSDLLIRPTLDVHGLIGVEPDDILSLCM